MPSPGFHRLAERYFAQGIAQQLGEIPLDAMDVGFNLVVRPDYVPPRVTSRHPVYAFSTALVRTQAAAPPAPVITATLARYPHRLITRPVISHRVPAWFGPRLPPAIVPGSGPAGVASFVLSLEPGTRVVYEWMTDVMKSYSGVEQRVSQLHIPRQSYQGSAYLLDEDDRDVRAAFVQYASQQSVFLLGLTYEEVTIAADYNGNVIPVSTTALDWTVSGQRVIVVGLDGTVSPAVVQSITPSSITVDVVPAAGARKYGGTVLPAMAVYLDPQQGLARYPVNETRWDLNARAAVFGYAGNDTINGGPVTFYTDPFNSHVWPVFDRPPAADAENPSGDSMQSLSDILDMGTTVIGMGVTNAFPDWGRQIRVKSANIRVWQWLKNFLMTLRGRQVSFLLPTWRPDLVYDSSGVNFLKIKSTSASPGMGNYLAWFATRVGNAYAQALYADGSVQYLTIIAVIDNLDGTLTLDITGQTLLGTPTMLSIMDIVRLESDTVEIVWSGTEFNVELMARGVRQ